MNTIKRILLVGLAIMIVCSLYACDNNDSDIPDVIYPEVDSSSFAISCVKNDEYVKQMIAQRLSFNYFFAPRYGQSTADENSDGSWTVTVKGTMQGYIDEYHRELKTYSFEATATISRQGVVTNVIVQKVG